VPVDGRAVEVEDGLSEAAVGETEAPQALDEPARVVRRVGRLRRVRKWPFDRQVVGGVPVPDTFDLFLDLAAADGRLARYLQVPDQAAVPPALDLVEERALVPAWRDETQLFQQRGVEVADAAGGIEDPDF